MMRTRIIPRRFHDFNPSKVTVIAIVDALSADSPSKGPLTRFFFPPLSPSCLAKARLYERFFRYGEVFAGKELPELRDPPQRRLPPTKKDFSLSFPLYLASFLVLSQDLKNFFFFRSPCPTILFPFPRQPAFFRIAGLPFSPP